ncbi:MAG TPA: hypothetical protein VF550_21115, partial [Polyangia bacterium]
MSKYGIVYLFPLLASAGLCNACGGGSHSTAQGQPDGAVDAPADDSGSATLDGGTSRFEPVATASYVAKV